jgi:hypothetical protein
MVIAQKFTHRKPRMLSRGIYTGLQFEGQTAGRRKCEEIKPPIAQMGTEKRCNAFSSSRIGAIRKIGGPNKTTE